METAWNLSAEVETFSMSFWHAIVLPAPVTPVKKTGCICLIFDSMSWEKLTVSLVGTTKSN